LPSYAQAYAQKALGKGAVILPHGVLFRGKLEAVIPQGDHQARLHQGHHRPCQRTFSTAPAFLACILILDKEHAQTTVRAFHDRRFERL